MLVKLGWDVWGGQLGGAAGGMPAAAAALPSPSLPVEMRGRFRKFGINAHSRTMYDEALNILCPASLAIRTMKIL